MLNARVVKTLGPVGQIIWPWGGFEAKLFALGRLRPQTYFLALPCIIWPRPRAELALLTFLLRAVLIAVSSDIV